MRKSLLRRFSAKIRQQNLRFRLCHVIAGWNVFVISASSEAELVPLGTKCKFIFIFLGVPEIFVKNLGRKQLGIPTPWSTVIVICTISCFTIFCRLYQHRSGHRINYWLLSLLFVILIASRGSSKSMHDLSTKTYCDPTTIPNNYMNLLFVNKWQTMSVVSKNGTIWRGYYCN